MENKRNEKYAVILAALLHDIGKFYQRSDKKIRFEDSEYLSSELRNNPTRVCKTNEHGRPIHAHALWTDQFFEDNDELLPKINFENNESVRWLASLHHNPSTSLERLVQLADWVSSGMDREKYNEDEQDELETDRTPNFRKERLMPVFNFLFSNENEKSIRKNKYPLNPLILEQSVFPKEFEEKKDLCQEYKSLWDKFIEELNTLDPLENDLTYFINGLLNILKKYTWCIPSSTNDRPDISLYDHLRTTAAAAACLFDYYEKKGETENSLKNRDDSKFLLIYGDISGIQDFIYKLTNKAANKGLKGRSFYVELFANAAVRYIIEELDLPDTNILYTGGGGFYLLLPVSAKKKIAEFGLNINTFLRDNLYGDLYLVLNYTELSISDFIDEENKLGEVWGELAQQSDENKKQKHKEFIKNGNFWEAQELKYLSFNELIERYGKELNKGETLRKIIEDAFIDSANLEYSKSIPQIPIKYLEFVKLGRDLMNANIMVEYVYNGDDNFGEYIFQFGEKTIAYSLFKNSKEKNKFERISEIVKTHIYLLNDFDKHKLNSIKAPIITKFYGGNNFPRDPDYNEYIKDFEALAKIDEEERYNRLAVIRMDVDNLGSAFSYGFYQEDRSQGTIKKSGASISRLASLSSMLDFFFAGYLNLLLQNFRYSIHTNIDTKEHSIIVYSGGDDLFIVTRWDIAPYLVKAIQKQFNKFVCGNSKLTLSGGIEIINPKFPIYRAAKAAGTKEELAKKFQLDYKYDGEPEKDSIFFISKPLRVRGYKIEDGSDFQNSIKLKEDLLKIIDEMDGNKGILNHLRNIYLTYYKRFKYLEENTNKSELNYNQWMEKLIYHKWRWLAAYQLARYKNKIDDDQNHSEIKTKLENLVNQIFDTKTDNNYRNLIQYLDVPIRWAEYELRDK